MSLGISNLLASVGLMTALLSIIFVHADQLGTAAIMAVSGMILFALSFLGDTE